MLATTTRILVVALTAAFASSPIWAGTAANGTGANAATRAGTRLATSYATLAGSESNAQALVDGLRSGGAITLAGATGTTTFTPATSAMGYGEVNTSLALAQAALSAQGITKPTAAQLEAALNGGTVTLSDGSTVTLKGVLALRASGEGWGQMARAMGVNLGAVVSASHTGHSHAGMRTDPVHGSARAGEAVQAHAAAAAHAGVDNLPPQVPSHPEIPSHPSLPQRPDIPTHVGRPGG